MDQYTHAATRRVPWNKGKLVGQKAPLKLKDIWAIRVRLQIQNRNPRTCLVQSSDRQQTEILLLGHTKLESTVRYLGIEVDDALEMAEQTEV